MNEVKKSAKETIIFEISDEAVFNTTLATLQLSVLTGPGGH